MPSAMCQFAGNSLPVEVAVRYGYEERPADRLREQLDQARSEGDWRRVAELAAKLERLLPRANPVVIAEARAMSQRRSCGCVLLVGEGMNTPRSLVPVSDRDGEN